MRNNIKTFTMFVRDKIDDNDRSEEVANSFRDLFAKLPTPITESDNGDLIIAVGGDGTFLDAVSKAKFDDKKIFAGVNTGTLGFLQNISPDEFSSFIQFYSDKKQILVRKVFLPKITVKLKNTEVHTLYALNEVILQGVHGQKISFAEYIDDDLYQKVSANLLCVASSTGDTALSMNAGGPIDFSNHFQLIRTLSIGVRNAAYENFLPNPVICPHFHFEIGKFNQSELLRDGRVQTFNSPISELDVSLFGAHFIHKLELGSYSKVRTVRSKILGYED